MRKLVLAGFVMALLAALPASAVAGPCVCRVWAQQFKRDAESQRIFDRQTMFNMSQAQARRTKQQVYNYADRNDFDDAFCKRHAKVCKAALACVVAGGGAYQAARASGASKKASSRAGAWSCAAAASTVMITA